MKQEYILFSRHHDCADDDNHQHRSAFFTAANLVREGDRHLSGHVLRLRLCRSPWVCCRQLHILGGEGQEEEEGEEAEGNNDCFALFNTSVSSQDKEEKERQMNSRAAVEETAEDRALNSIGLEEEIIELQDLRMSPIPSLRNRHKAKYYKEPGGRLHGMCLNSSFILINC